MSQRVITEFDHHDFKSLSEKIARVMYHKRDRITEPLINLYGLIKAFSIKRNCLRGIYAL